MAEAMLREKVKQHPHIEVRSAGIHAFTGDEISPHALELLKERGINASAHRSTRLSPLLLDWATDVYAMTAIHMKHMTDAFPEAKEKTFLLLPKGGGIPDPFGKGRLTYAESLRLIEQGIGVILKEKII